MRTERFDWDGREVFGLAERIRALQPTLEEVGDAVAGILAEVERGGDAALREVSARVGEPLPDSLLVPKEEIAAAVVDLEPELLRALETAAANVAQVAEAQGPAVSDVPLPQGQRVASREVAVASAGIYAPGGSAGYPSSVIMGCVAARAAGVDRVVLVTPPGPGGSPSPATLAAASTARADEVYAVGGAQAIAALAYGTESIAPVDVIAGPGNRYVQEAKRRVVGRVAIEGIAGPSELMVIAGDGADPGLLALDLCAQAEHGADGLLVAAGADQEILDAIGERVAELAADRSSVTDSPFALVRTPTTPDAAALAEALAPEHLEIVDGAAKALAGGLSTPGCIFLGAEGAAAFGDYIAGSNHVLPTGGAGRYQGPLGPGAFRRRISTVMMGPSAPAELAGAAATLARAEGFPVHGESMEARA